MFFSVQISAGVNTFCCLNRHKSLMVVLYFCSRTNFGRYNTELFNTFHCLYKLKSLMVGRKNTFIFVPEPTSGGTTPTRTRMASPAFAEVASGRTGLNFITKSLTHFTASLTVFSLSYKVWEESKGTKNLD